MFGFLFKKGLEGLAKSNFDSDYQKLSSLSDTDKKSAANSMKLIFGSATKARSDDDTEKLKSMMQVATESRRHVLSVSATDNDPHWLAYALMETFCQLLIANNPQTYEMREKLLASFIEQHSSP